MKTTEMVKKCLLLPLLAAAFIACSDDDDNNGGNNEGKETASFTYEKEKKPLLSPTNSQPIPKCLKSPM